MAEIKTCEHYVLSRLQDMEEQNECLKDNLMALEKDYSKLQTDFNTLREVLFKYVKVKTFQSGGKECQYISFEDIDGWHSDCKDDFTFLVENFNLKKEE